MPDQAKIDILIEGAQSAKTLGDLEKSAEDLTEALKETDIGTQEYEKLRQQLIGTNTQVKNLELSFEALDQEQVASEIGSVAGAIGDVTSSIILLGGENETMQEVAQNIEKALGVSMAFKGAIEGVSSAQKLLNNQMQKGTVIGKIFATVQKGINAVMNANPIGLIITGIALLVAGFITLIETVEPVKEFFEDLSESVSDFIDSLGLLGDAVRLLLLPFTLLFELTNMMFEAQIQQQKELTEAEEQRERQRKIQNQRITADHKMRLKEIEDRRAAEKQAFDSKQEEFDLEIARMEAEGKNAFALREAKQEAVLAEIEDQLKAIAEIRESWVSYYEEQFRLSGKSREDFIKQLKGQGIDIVALQEELNEKVEDLNKQAFQAETELIKLQTAERQKQAAEAKKIADEEQKIKDEMRKREEEADKLFLERQKELEERRLDFIKASREKLADANADEFQLRMNTLIREHEEELALIQELGIADNELKLQLERDFQAQMAQIKQEAAIADAEAEEQQNQEKLERNTEFANNTIANAKAVVDLAQTINNLAFQKDVDRIKAKEARGEALTKGEIKRLKRQNAINKAFAVAQIAIDTATAVSGAITQAQSVPFPANIAAIAAGVTAVLSGIAGAAAALGKSPDLPDAGAITSGAGEAGQRAIEDLTGEPNLNPVQTGSTVFGGGGAQKVFVLESDITDKQEQVKVQDSQASFG